MMRVCPLLAALLPVALAACTVGPDHVRPVAAEAPAYKEAALFRPAAPADALDRGPWWELFGDPELDALAEKVARSNQDVLAAAAAYAQARGVVREARSFLYPVVGANAAYSRNRVGTQGGDLGGASRSGGRYEVAAGASWTPDLFGGTRRGIEAARAGTDAAAADVANLVLALTGELVLNYLQLRSLDEEKRVLDATVSAYERDLEITNNRYRAGVVAKVDVVQAETQLLNARAATRELLRQRSQLEHAIAVLTGEPPSALTIAPRDEWRPVMPAPPAGVPSELLERRPDIAAAERRVAAANAEIGIETAAFYPAVTIGGSVGQTASSLTSLFTSAANFWSLGPQIAYTMLDFGGRKARVEQARAFHAQTVANYRSTVLAAFQEVEDQLVATRALSEEYEIQQQAARSASEAEALIRNQYKAGQVSFSDVIIAQTQALNTRRAVIQSGAGAQASAAGLILALGGGWDAATAVPPDAAAGAALAGASASRD